MNVLIIKTSSMGDVVHTLPALTDAQRAVPGIRFDWVVEEAYAEIPAWHPAVDKVIPLALRRWRKQLWRSLVSDEWRVFRNLMEERSYDYIIDAQGLIKSALIMSLGHGERCGFDRNSVREPLAALVYQRSYEVAKNMHAVERVRRLFALTLGYPPPTQDEDYGIDKTRFTISPTERPYLVFLHGTTWPTKHWPESYWMVLARLCCDAGYDVYLPWGNDTERLRAERIANSAAGTQVLPRMELNQLAGVLAGARAVVGVDTGLAHIAAALAVPSVTLYGATSPQRTGTYGESQTHLCANFRCAPCLKRQCTYTGDTQVLPACYQTLPPERVWEALHEGASLPILLTPKTSTM